MAQHKGFSCAACGAEFDTREQLADHNKSAHEHGAQPGANVGGSAGRTPTSGESGDSAGGHSEGKK